MKVYFRALNGCAMRRQKIKQYQQYLLANDHTVTSKVDDADVCFIWTCAFRGDFLRNSLRIIREYQKDYKRKIIVGGCLPDIAPDELKKHFNGYVINWRDDARKMAEIFGEKNGDAGKYNPIFTEAKLCDDAEEYRRNNPGKDAQFHDQFIKLVISEGCKYKCSYCSERLAFPPFRSFPEDELVEACRKMVEETGEYDVILLADSLGQYGCDINSDLPSLIKKLKAIHPNVKLALNNMNPASFIDFFDEITDFIKAGVIKHINLPIQSASSRMLQLMNRDYGRQQLDAIFGWFNENGFKEFDTHVIIGFPGEKDADIDETIDFIVYHKPRYVLASKYMEMPSMDSAALPDKVDEAKKKHRLQRFARAMEKNRIICNSEEGDLIKSRFKRIKEAP